MPQSFDILDRFGQVDVPPMSLGCTRGVVIKALIFEIEVCLSCGPRALARGNRKTATGGSMDVLTIEASVRLSRGQEIDIEQASGGLACSIYALVNSTGNSDICHFPPGKCCRMMTCPEITPIPARAGVDGL